MVFTRPDGSRTPVPIRTTGRRTHLPRSVGLAVAAASLDLYLPGSEVDGQPADGVVVVAGGAKVEPDVPRVR